MTKPYFCAGGERQARLSSDIGRVMGLLDSSPPQYGVMGGVVTGVVTGVGNIQGVSTISPSSGPVWRGDDLLYLWDLTGQRQPNTMMRVEDRLISQNLTRVWATFASRGFPIFSEGLLQAQGQQLQQLQSRVKSLETQQYNS